MKVVAGVTNELGIIYSVRTQNFPNISYPLTRAYQRVRNVSFSENFVYVLNQWTPNKLIHLTISKNPSIACVKCDNVTCVKCDSFRNLL